MNGLDLPEICVLYLSEIQNKAGTVEWRRVTLFCLSLAPVKLTHRGLKLNINQPENQDFDQLTLVTYH